MKYYTLLRQKLQGVVGLEIHAQIASKSKLFSASGTMYDAPSNSQVSFFDMATPGTMPMLNKRCVEAAVMTAIALNAHIHLRSRFDRKHYFYADLPFGYQITQHAMPLANGGSVDYILLDEKDRKQAKLRTAQITQIQLEQDSGRSFHDEVEGHSLIDLNRAGLPLMEIITEPCFESGRDAAAFVRDLSTILTALGVCSGKITEGALRVDANVSVHRPGEPLGVRTEIKNVNGVKNVRKAIDYEINRQVAVLQDGTEKIIGMTMEFDSDKGCTVPMRVKEDFDYRFMPEYNLPILTLAEGQSSHPDILSIQHISSTIPGLPAAGRERLMEEYNLSLGAAYLILERGDLLVDLFQMMHAARVSTSHGLSTSDSLLSFIHKNADQLLDILEKESLPISKILDVYDNLLSKHITIGVVAKLLAVLPGSSESVDEVINGQSWSQITDEVFIAKSCREFLLTKYPKKLARQHNNKGKRAPIIELQRLFTKKLGGPDRVEPVEIYRILRDEVGKIKE